MARKELSEAERLARKEEAMTAAANEKAEAAAERKEEKKGRKSVVRELAAKLWDTFIAQAEEGITIYRGDAIRKFDLKENFNGTSTAMLASIARVARQIKRLGEQAEDHIEMRHWTNKKFNDNRRIQKIINRQIKKGKLAKLPEGVTLDNPTDKD